MVSLLKELTAEEKAKPYSKYYYRQPSPPDSETLDLLQPEKPIDATTALAIENINDLLQPGYLETETGYCVLPNGAGYVAVNNKMPGVTVEMVNWWFAWHSLEDLRYKIWWPEGHYGISISDEARKKVLDSTIPLKQKSEGITHYVIEDAGGGAENISIHFLVPEDAGFDTKGFNSSNVGAIFVANGLSSRVGTPSDAPKIPSVMCHFVRDIPGGIEFRSRFWMGYQMVDQKPKLLLPPGIRVPDVVPFGLAMHCALEYANLRAILPQVYQEQQESFVD